MGVDDGIELILKAYHCKDEEKAFKLYTARYQHMTEKDHITFEEFYKPNKQLSGRKSAKEILEDVKGILNTFKKEGEGNRTI